MAFRPTPTARMDASRSSVKRSTMLVRSWSRVLPACWPSLRGGSGPPGLQPAAGWSGRTAQSHRCSRRRTPRVCGPQFDAAWCDELAKWRHADAAFDTLQFGLRLGLRPRQLITTTPRPIPLIKRLLADPHTRVTRAPTSANKDFLAPTFLDTVVARYAGTRLGRQELDGELIEDRPDALWSRELIERCRVSAAPQLSRVVVAIDPPGSSKRGADACGIVAVGRSESGSV